MRRRARPVAVAVLALALLGLSATPVRGAVARPAGCAPAASGGEWRDYGRTLANDRTQPAETSLGPGQVAKLHEAWRFSVPAAGGTGSFQSTPVVADGCVFMGTDAGSVFALAADTGRLVWSRKLPITAAGGGLTASSIAGNGLVGSTVVHNSKVFGIVSVNSAPYAIALDESTGKTLWSQVLDRQPGVFTDASPVVFEGLVLAAFNADETNPEGRGGYVVLDEHTGNVLARQYVIPDADHANGYGGASIWATAVVDAATKHAYVGTGNPSSKKEHPRSNAILKIDVDRARPTFGQIVGSAKGEPETYAAALEPLTQPVCDRVQTGGLPLLPGQLHAYADNTFACAHLDMDFGSSPNLFRRNGRPVVGEMQKSGVYHVVDAATMAPIWRTAVGAPFTFANGASSATDGRRVYVDALPGVLSALDTLTGRVLWAASTADAIHFEAITVADGVVYTVDTAGFLDAFDAGTGLQLVKRPLVVDNGADPSAVANYTSASVSVARHTLYVASSGTLLAYEP